MAGPLSLEGQCNSQALHSDRAYICGALCLEAKLGMKFLPVVVHGEGQQPFERAEALRKPFMGEQVLAESQSLKGCQRTYIGG
jgi:hypothetical protein